MNVIFLLAPFSVALGLLALSTLVAARPLPAPTTYVVDRAHSEINFVADSRLLSAHGFFDKWDANSVLDPANVEASSVAITIEAASIKTRVTMRDNCLTRVAMHEFAVVSAMRSRSVAIAGVDAVMTFM